MSVSSGLIPPNTIHADICILGAGSAGLSVAAGAAQLGAETVLIERDRMGGDCLNTGCVPSKSLIAAGHALHAVNASRAFGVHANLQTVNYGEVHKHVHDVISSIAPHDSVERFENLGCTVLHGQASFLDKDKVVVGDTTVIARRFVIATGSRAAIPSITGLAAVPYHTNETIFDLQDLPDHLIVIGGGPIGVELSQAFRRLGADVTVLVRSRILPKEDPDAVSVIRQTLKNDGVIVHEDFDFQEIQKDEDGICVIQNDGKQIKGSHLLIAVGRQPNIDGLNLEAAGVEYTGKGICVDKRLRTSNSRIFAAGDVAGGPQFTHWAGYHAGIIIRNALFRLPAKVDDTALPRVTYTDPELAHVGLTEAQARDKFGEKITVLTSPFLENDRARTEKQTEGFAKVIVTKKGKILGATVVGKNAGDLVQTWVLAIASSIKIGAIAGMIAPYPTRGEINKRLAGAFFTPKVFSNTMRWIVKFLGSFG